MAYTQLFIDWDWKKYIFDQPQVCLETKSCIIKNNILDF